MQVINVIVIEYYGIHMRKTYLYTEWWRGKVKGREAVLIKVLTTSIYMKPVANCEYTNIKDTFNQAICQSIH